MAQRPRGGWFEYSPEGVEAVRHGSLRWWWRTHGRQGGFRYNELNLAGWAAVLLPGAVGGLAAGRLWGAPVWLTTIAGMVVSWVLALVVDRWQGARRPVTIEVSDLGLATVDRLVAELRQEGVTVTVRQWNPPAEPDGQAAPPARCALRTTGRFRRRVLAAVEAERQRRHGS